MNFFEIFAVALGVSMDAFAVAICKGMSFKRASIKNALIVALYFGIFQAAMPLIGYFLGSQFSENIVKYDHWLAFILLGAIGANMIKESSNKSCEAVEEVAVVSGNGVLERGLCFKTMLILAIATSIDALAVGITLAFLKVHIVPAVIFIGIITFINSFVGVKIGNVFGVKYKSRAEFVGGIILMAMGTKILLEHIGLISF
ncbi:MAG: manganese efflux pump [Tissierellia bacterium]|nr:manganese efflux pump [Tissierellia bacterium]